MRPILFAAVNIDGFVDAEDNEPKDRPQKKSKAVSAQAL